MKKILNIVGARPNFVKMAPIHRALLESSEFEPVLVHTGQHYDKTMSEDVMRELELPDPDRFLGIGGGSHGAQTGRIMEALEIVVDEERPDAVIVVGDVNSTVAAALVTAKSDALLCHVEAGLRSGDRSMPEEINRLATDVISDFLFVTEPSGIENLRKEGIAEEKIHFVGNVMIDSLVRFLEKARALNTVQDYGLEPKTYGLATLHRPSNVDTPEDLAEVVDVLLETARIMPIVFSAHPRTTGRLKEFGYIERLESEERIRLIPPQSYLSFLSLMDTSAFVLTDSGGLQEETTYLGVPCLTVRENTERPVTVEVGTNVLVKRDPPAIAALVERIAQGSWKKGSVPELWDGKTASRIVKVLSGI